MKMQTSAVTQSMTANTVQFGAHRHHEPSRQALATRSLTAADRLTGAARGEALEQHFEDFPPVIGSSCRL